MSYPYSPLFQPLKLGKNLTIKNRFCVGPLRGILRRRPGLL